MIIEFPRGRSRGIWVRRPRRSKNGTPEERAARKAAAQRNAEVVELQQQPAIAPSVCDAKAAEVAS
jgi:hypothetical protein